MYYETFEKLCNLKGIKPGRVSKETGISTATLTSWKQGKYTPKQDKLSLIADYFDVSVDYLMTGEENSITDDMVGEHIELISLYENLTQEQKDHVLNMMRLFNNK